MNTDLIEKILREKYGWETYPLKIERAEDKEENNDS
jgi:hypothetical protein